MVTVARAFLRPAVELHNTSTYFTSTIYFAACYYAIVHVAQLKLPLASMYCLPWSSSFSYNTNRIMWVCTLVKRACKNHLQWQQRKLTGGASCFTNCVGRGLRNCISIFLARAEYGWSARRSSSLSRGSYCNSTVHEQIILFEGQGQLRSKSKTTLTSRVDRVSFSELSTSFMSIHRLSPSTLCDTAHNFKLNVKTN